MRRMRDFEIALEIRNDQFVSPPRPAQRNWLINGALSEFADNLAALDRLAAKFVPGQDITIGADRTQAALSDEEIMEDWQVPLMRAMASIVGATHGDVLEVGFGRGVSAGFIQEHDIRSHTIIECNDSIVERFESWRAHYPGRDLRMVHGKWQDVLDTLGQFDAIFFHTYPLDEEEFIEQVGRSTTFAEHFFAHAAAHLVEGGVFTYLSNEIDSLGREHQRKLLQHFRSIRLQVLGDLAVPRDVRDAWWADSMVVVEAVR